MTTHTYNTPFFPPFVYVQQQNNTTTTNTHKLSHNLSSSHPPPLGPRFIYIWQLSLPNIFVPPAPASLPKVLGRFPFIPERKREEQCFQKV